MQTKLTPEQYAAIKQGLRVFFFRMKEIRAGVEKACVEINKTKAIRPVNQKV